MIVMLLDAAVALTVIPEVGIGGFSAAAPLEFLSGLE